MNQRRRKRTVKELFHSRFYNTRFVWWSAEDRAWESMAPVGREFGSPDFERLMNEDADQWQAKLANLVAICSEGKEPVLEASEFREDAINVQWALKERGYVVDLETAARVWKHHSRSLMAGWMSGAQSAMSAQRAITVYCMLAPGVENEDRPLQ